MTPFIDVTTKISSVGSKVFEIQRKIYADSCPVKKASKPSSHSHSHHNGHGGAKASVGDVSSSNLNATQLPPLQAMMNTFTEATANAYQEWNVVKKNKFGRRQERIFGVDGKKIYNAKRGALRGGNQAGVHRAERDISSIVKIEILSEENSVGNVVNNGGTNLNAGANGNTVTTAGNSSALGHPSHNASNKDLAALATNANSSNPSGLESLGSRTFRITWAESNDIYNIEYTTDTSRECLEIVAKVKYLMNRLKRGGAGAGH